ncbi:MAG: CBS domain-containing protein [Gammaproteobacteria bacterium]|nr:CBS domain-containing protein [Gammaproteobacteria bacterium]
MFEWLADPAIWAGLLALIALEIVLGIDNLVFIAVLAEKLPPQQRDKARIVGLSLALVMRLLLLLSIAWLVTLTTPLFSLFDRGYSLRDLIMLMGGLFLLFKATMELHERLEGRQQESGGTVAYAGFAVVVTQIVVLDAVFSIDSVITAIGMADEVAVMAVAMIVAMGVMLAASKALTRFVNQRPTLVILCLGFLLMIGFSLIVEGLGYKIPKGYLYAAIGFSIMVEAFNQVAQHNKEKWLNRAGTLRERTANNILRLLGRDAEPEAAGTIADDPQAHQRPLFQDNERDMIQSVLNLAQTNVKALMTHRRDVHMLDLAVSSERQREQLLASPHSRIVVIRDGRQDEPLGIVQKKTLLHAMLRGRQPDVEKYLEPAAVLLETQTAIAALETLRRAGRQLAFVVDEFGTLEGVVSLKDILEAIAGDISEADEPRHVPCVEARADGRYWVDAGESLNEINRHLSQPLPTDEGYTTLAGLILDRLERMPVEGELLQVDSWQVRVMQVEDAMRIVQVELEPVRGGD